jgi:hypothetical protein
MTTCPSTMNAQRRRPAASTSETMPTDRTFRTGVMMCIIWLSAATMLICQAQKTDLVGNRFAPKQVFLVFGS